MTQQVQELIDKIKKEGLAEVQEKSRQVVDEAEKKAAQIIAEAHRQAEALMAKAKQDNERHEQATQVALKQAARDMLLDLRKQIETVLDSIIKSEVKQALETSSLIKMIETVIVKYVEANKDIKDISVALSAADLKKLKEGFIPKLKEKVKQPITFESEEAIQAGFTISFDEGKSRFDFSDEGLVQYLGGHVREELSTLLKDSVSQSN